MSTKAITLQRPSMKALLEELTARGPNSRGVVAIIVGKDGGASFRISGFEEPLAAFTVAGLCEWIKADLMRDL